MTNWLFFTPFSHPLEKMEGGEKNKEPVLKQILGPQIFTV